MNDPGLFITFEGIDGSGKTTQASLFSQYLEKRGQHHHLTREPGGSEASEGVRSLLKHAHYAWTPLAQFFLFMASRHQHVVQSIRPALAEGCWVVCDRFSDSTFVYQGHFLKHSVDPALLSAVAMCAAEHLKPDLTFIIDLDPQQARTRMIKDMRASTDAYDTMRMEDVYILRNRFIQCAQDHPERCILVQGHDGAAEDIHHTIVQIFQEWYERRTHLKK